MKTLFLALLLALAAAIYVLLFYPLRNPHPLPALVHGTLAIRDVRVYPSPGAPPLEHANVILRDGVIAAAGAGVPIPENSQIVSCPNCSLTAGFWNAHVHFTEPKWIPAAFASANKLDAALADMLTSRGFTTVVDTGSDLRVTLSLRRRIESGELAGPAIYTAGAGIYPPKGIPYYLKNDVPFYILWMMPQPETPLEAVRSMERNRSRGADIVKLFTGSYIARGNVLPMPVDIAKAVVTAAHAEGILVYSHPSDLRGTRVAMESGVDVLAHAPDTTDGIDAAMIQEVVDRKMAMVPTLKMFAGTVKTDSAYLKPIYAIVEQFHKAGGQLLFGTDAGYMTDYRTEEEFLALKECGLTPRDILSMLTTNPAARFRSGEKGTVAPGQSGDLVLLDGDPMQDIGAFSRVRCTIRRGRILYQAPAR